MLYAPVKPLIYATGMEIALSLTSGRTPDISLLTDSFKNALYNIWPVSLSGTILAGILPKYEEKRYSKEEEIILYLFGTPVCLWYSWKHRNFSWEYL
jgi:Na+/serine symporter